jgi:hypothetical protein
MKMYHFLIAIENEREKESEASKRVKIHNASSLSLNCITYILKGSNREKEKIVFVSFNKLY